MSAIAAVAERLGQTRRRRPRTEEERRMLCRATIALVEQRERSGKLIWRGDRHVELRP